MPLTPVVFADTNAFSNSSYPALLKLQQSGKIKLCMSDHLVAEMVKGDNAAFGLAKLKELNDLNPLYADDATSILVNELRSQLLKHVYGIMPPYTPLFPNLASRLTYEDPKYPEPLLTLQGWAEHLWAHPKLQKTLAEANQEAADALNVLRRARRKQVEATLPASLKPTVLRRFAKCEWPAKMPITRGEAVQYIISNWEALLVKMPGTRVEHELMEYRISRRDRTAVPNDFSDLMHLITGLAYADYFVSNDRFVFDCGVHVASRVPGTAKVVRKVDDLLAILASPGRAGKSCP